MKRVGIIVMLISCLAGSAMAQKYLTKEGVIDIFSETSLFVIEAKNQNVASILNAENGEVVASTLVRSFKFREALVEEHFNENYMESHKFPKAQFKGKITNFSSVDIKKNGSYPITIEGNLTLHGETQAMTSEGTLIVKSGSIEASTEFFISLDSYKIMVEEKYKDRIKVEIKLIIHFNYKSM